MVNRYITNAEEFYYTHLYVYKCIGQRQRDVQFVKRFKVPCTWCTHTFIGVYRVVNRCVRDLGDLGDFDDNYHAL